MLYPLLKSLAEQIPGAVKAVVDGLGRGVEDGGSIGGGKVLPFAKDDHLSHIGRQSLDFRPHGSGSDWCDAEVLRRLRRRSLAALRHEVEPVDQGTLGRFLPAWQHVGGKLRGIVASEVKRVGSVVVRLDLQVRG